MKKSTLKTKLYTKKEKEKKISWAQVDLRKDKMKNIDDKFISKTNLVFELIEEI